MIEMTENIPAILRPTKHKKTQIMLVFTVFFSNIFIFSVLIEVHTSFTNFLLVFPTTVFLLYVTVYLPALCASSALL